MEKLVIDRAKWVRGSKGGEASLLNSELNMCCLGFYCRLKGASFGDIEGKSYPSDVDLEGEPDLGISFWEPFAEANDDDDISEEERETRIKKMFKRELKIEVEFKGRRGR